MKAKKYFMSWIVRRTSKSAKKSYPTKNFSPHDIYHCQLQNKSKQVKNSSHLRWLNTVLAVCECTSFAKSWKEKGCSSQAETWQVKNILMKDFD